ncbi:MAG: hypothetical protein K0S74_880 [Chlamydiales bacterium]|nr:hypothetical protein [Chlamydiales bacterium]
MVVEKILFNHPTGIFDYSTLMVLLKDYKKPRDKLTLLMQNKDLIRIKKGLYVVGDFYRKQPISKEVLANLIYGPSYISLEYALSYWGLIPEKVETITCVTPQKNKDYQTQLGCFSYQYLQLEKYQVGITRETLGDDTSAFFIANREKALSDYLYVHRVSFENWEQLLGYLIESMRIELSDLKNLSIQELELIQSSYKNKTVAQLYQLILNLKVNYE